MNNDDDFIQTLIINVKVLTKLEVLDRPIFMDKYVSISKYHFFSPLVRYIQGQSRSIVLNGLTKLKNDILIVFTNDKYSKYRDELLIDLKLFLDLGLKNLESTYFNDQVTKSLLEYIRISLTKVIT